MAEIRGRVSWTDHDMLERQRSQPSGPVLNASQLAPLVNSYTVHPGPPKTVALPNASKLAQLQEVSVSGTLLPKQFIALDSRTNKRTVSADPAGYTINANDGDLHIDLGTAALQPHITCELQNARASLSSITAAVGQQVVIEGFFRCLFEHPGFDVKDDAHIFEIHPVRAVSIAGKIRSFDVGIPDQQSIHTWTSPHPLNVQDNRIQVKYDAAGDILTFSGMDGSDENYVRVSGTVSQVQLNLTGGPATFVLSSPEIGHSIQVFCLQGSTASRQLAHLTSTKASMVALRNIDLSSAMKGRYSINLLGIDIQPA
jgi:hypothetical protein